MVSMRWPRCLRAGSSRGDSCQLGRLGQLHGLQLLQPGDQQVAVGTDEIALPRTDAQVDDAVLGLVEERAVEPRETVVVHLAAKLLLHLQLGLPPELAGDEAARPGADAVADVVAGDVEDLSLVGDAADHDMSVRLARIEMVHRQPIQGRIEVPLHLPHELARERLEVPELHAVLGGNDEPELVPVLQPPIGKGPGVGAIVLARVGLAVLTVSRDSLALQVAQVGSDGVALHALQLDHPRLDDDAAGSIAHAAGPGLAGRRLPATVAVERSSGVASPAARIEAAARLSCP
jgi:hypothetical protein